MYVELLPSETTLLRGNTYTFTLKRRSDGHVDSPSFWLFAYINKGYKSIISGYSWEEYDEDDYWGYYPHDWTQTVTIPNEADGVSFHFSCIEDGSSVSQTVEYTCVTPPSNFKAVQNGKHVALSWTAGSGGGEFTYLPTIDGDTSIAPLTTGTSAVWNDCSEYFSRTITLKLVCYLNGSAYSHLTLSLSLATPSASASISVSQPARSSTISIVWSGSCSGMTATNVNYTIAIGTSTIRTATSAGSASYTPPAYGVSYTYKVTAVFTNAYGDQFTGTASQSFTAKPPYYTVGVVVEGGYVNCIAHAVVDGQWKECNPHAVFEGQWKLCSTT